MFTLHKRVDPKEADVNFCTSRFFQFYLLHILYFAFLGPFLAFFMRLAFGNYRLAHNMAFTPWHGALFAKVVQTILWLGWVTPVGIVIYKLAQNDWSLYIVHEQGYDLVFLGFMFFQQNYRAWMIAMKYAVYTDNMMWRLNNELLTAAEITGDLLTVGWFGATPETLLNELAYSLVRMDIEPRLLTMRVLNYIPKTA